MIKFLLFTLLCLFSFLSAHAQKRIGLDVNTHLTNINVTAHYQQVVKGQFLFSSGVFGGKFGEGMNQNNANLIFSGHDLGIAYPALPATYSDTNGQYVLGSTWTEGYGIGLYGGIGWFREFENFHGIRFNLNQRFGWMLSDVRSSYYLQQNQSRIHHTYHRIWHPVGAVSAELYHTVRMNGRYTFYWGVKVPYYFTLDKGKFRPEKDSEVFHKLLFDLSLGFTYAIGNCE